jgi:hypothetical protein
MPDEVLIKLLESATAPSLVLLLAWFITRELWPVVRDVWLSAKLDQQRRTLVLAEELISVAKDATIAIQHLADVLASRTE